MPLSRTLLRFLLGRRLPVTDGELRVAGPAAPVVIRRDRWGIPHVEAESLRDAHFGLGFCQGQDRAFQLELVLRIGRGRMAELVGSRGVGIDRVSRRIGFRRAAEAQLGALSAASRAALEAFVAGVNAGRTAGLTQKPHEFAILGGGPTPWDPADVLAFLKVQSFLLPSNWDVELARLRILLADGPGAVRDLEPADARAELEADLARFAHLAGPGGGSNAWAIAGSRTASGKPILSSDPHLAAMLPAPWYLAHVVTPEAAVAGASMVGAPGFPIGHNDHACWGCTAGLTDVTDLVLETLGPDGRSYRCADGSFEPCTIVREVIPVRGGADVVEEVLVTPRGPVLTTVGKSHALAVRAVWLEPLPLDGFLTAQTAADFDGFRRPFAEWPVLPLNVIYADAGGTIGWQLVGQTPVRTAGHGLLPALAEDGWSGRIPFEAMPVVRDPADGYVASANDPPRTDGRVYLGVDYLDPYRARVIGEEIAKTADGWTVAECQRLQLNVRSIPWQELRGAVLALPEADADVRLGLELLREWAGHVDADSPAAAVFELFVAEVCVRLARAKAPRAWESAVGGGGPTAGSEGGPFARNLFVDRRIGHLIRLAREQPPGWFARPWPDELADALGTVVRRLRKRSGPGPAWWQWGDLRMLALRHPLFGGHRLLGPAFALPAVPCGGDMNTVAQAGTRPTSPTAPAHTIPNLRAVFDTADWENSRFVLAGGQSGNPCSRHFDDLFGRWRENDGVPIAWSREAVLRAAAATLRVVPG